MVTSGRPRPFHPDLIYPKRPITLHFVTMVDTTWRGPLLSNAGSRDVNVGTQRRDAELRRGRAIWWLLRANSSASHLNCVRYPMFHHAGMCVHFILVSLRNRWVHNIEQVEYAASNGGMGEELERIWKDAVVALSWYYNGFSRRDWENSTKSSTS
jgi:hypothetical protein